MAGGEEKNTQLKAALLALLALQLGLLIGLAWQTPFTSDGVHYLAGGAEIRTTLSWAHPETFKHGPLFYYAQQLPAMLGVPLEPVDDYRPWGRLGTIAFSLMTSLLLVSIARRVASGSVALIALLLFVSNPLALGHGALITADMPLCACYLLVVLLAWRYFEDPGLSRLLLLGAGLAMALATKYVALLLVPVLLATALVLTALGFRPRLWMSRQPGPRWRAFADLLPAMGVVAVAALVVLHACYLFQAGWADPVAHRPTHIPPGLGWLLRPLPAPFVAGVDFQLGAGTGYLTFCLNQVCAGHWAYYLVAFLTKLPLGMLVALALAPFLRGPRWPDKLTTLLWFAGLAPLVYLSLFASLQMGLRYQLALLPILCLLAARPLGWLWTRGGAARLLSMALLLSAVLSSLWAWPNYIGYFHELARSRPYLLFGDSNLDWRGRRRHHPNEDMLRQRHPGAQRVHWASGPRLGTVLVHGLDLWPKDQPPGPVRHWLRRFQPLDRQAAWFVFRVLRVDYHSQMAAGDPDAALDLAAALLATKNPADRQEALRLAAEFPGARSQTIRNQARNLNNPAASVARVLDGWTALGRHDQVLAHPRADPRCRAFAHYARHEWGQCRRLLEGLGKQRPLDPAESIRLIYSCFHLADVEGTLAALERFRPALGTPAHRQRQAFQAQLIQLKDHLRRIGCR